MPLTPLMSCHTDDLGGAEGVEAVHEGNADVDFCGLSVGVSCHDALAEGFQAAHLRLDPAAGVVSGPAFPEGPAVVPRGAQGVVSGACCGAVFFPKTSVPADRDERNARKLVMP
ncbi:MAG: hypothetical protein HLUCCA12_18220 [Rhodobacteraceae bacterium HLUCCA12]|nr:MAG: hypothetical protein HLUCCA12_18220 [Rhodobacteraceae bacterium HLUCCA12]